MDEQKFGIVDVDGWSLVKFESEAEPRVPATEIGERLGYKEPRQVKELIERSREELSKYGGIINRRTVRRWVAGGGARREEVVSEPCLNEAQTLLICLRSDAPNAADIRFEVIDVYLKVKKAAETAGVSMGQLLNHVQTMAEEIRELKALTASNTNNLSLRLLRLEENQSGPGLVNKMQANGVTKGISGVAKLKAVLDKIPFSSARMKVENELRATVGFPRTVGAAWKWLPLDKLGLTNSKLAGMMEVENRRYISEYIPDQQQQQLFA